MTLLFLLVGVAIIALYRIYSDMMFLLLLADIAIMAIYSPLYHFTDFAMTISRYVSHNGHMILTRRPLHLGLVLPYPVLEKEILWYPDLRGVQP